MNAQPHTLDRFLVAQLADYETALAELRRGRKESHWIWYVLPQLQGLGGSYMSREYGIHGVEEATQYLKHPILGPRLVECVDAICAHTDKSAIEILGDLDALKFRSCLTLFAAASPDGPPFVSALRQFFDGRPDPQTIQLLVAG